MCKLLGLGATDLLPFDWTGNKSHAKPQRRKAAYDAFNVSIFSAPLRLCVSIFLTLCLTHALPAADATPLTPTQIARLESLCRVWGVVKFFHPWIVAPPDGKPIDWDAALIETIPLVEKASTTEEFRAAINHLFSALHDPSTQAINPAPNEFRPEPATLEPALPKTKMVATDNTKVLVIDATDWQRLGADQSKVSGRLFTQAFAEAASADAIVFDLRRLDKPPPGYDADAAVVSSALRADVARLLKVDLILSATRSRFHSGYVPEQGSLPGPYHSGIAVREHVVLRSRPGPGAGKKLVILTNSRVRRMSLLAALQASGQAVICHESLDSSNVAESETYSMQFADDIVASVRTTDLVNADGTIGFVPDVIGAPPSGGGDDTLMAKALAIARNELKPPQRSLSRQLSGGQRVPENLYLDMATPTRAYRLLGLFRVWNVIHYLFPYKQLMDRSWDSLLTEFIPRFAQADDPGDYGLTVCELAAHLQDSHVTVSGSLATTALSRQFGSASPLILTRIIEEEVVVVAADASLEGRTKVGDIVLAVDDELIANRIARINRYFAASTQQDLRAKVVYWSGLVLAGPPDTSAKLKLRTAHGTIREETLPRSTDPVAQGRLYRSVRLSRTSPTYGVLPQGFGYFDLTRLAMRQVDAAFEAVKDAPALIIDMRGAPQADTGFSIRSRLTDRPTTAALLRVPYLTSPDPKRKYDATFAQSIEPSPLWKYKGRVVVLINEGAGSSAEHNCLGFEEAAKGRSMFLGTPTAGVNGNVTNTSMPGGIRINFTGMDIRHADGRQLQRVGIQPDIRVEPTIPGIVAGKDEVLEAAIRFLNESKK